MCKEIIYKLPEEIHYSFPRFVRVSGEGLVEKLLLDMGPEGLVRFGKNLLNMCLMSNQK